MAKKPKMLDVRIDPEFESLIDPLTDEEYQQLKENIRKYGLQDKIKYWEVIEKRGDVYCPLGYKVIVDGHNRHKIINELAEEEPGSWSPYDPDDYDPVEGLSTREQVREYIIKNQLGRRNLTREQKLRLIGQMQANRKKSHGGDRKSEESKGQNEPLKSTAAQIAEEVGVSESTVKRAEKFSKGIDALEKVSKEAAEKVLKGKANVTTADVVNFPKLNPDEQNEFAGAVVEGNKPKKFIIQREEPTPAPKRIFQREKKSDSDSQPSIYATENVVASYKKDDVKKENETKTNICNDCMKTLAKASETLCGLKLMADDELLKFTDKEQNQKLRLMLEDLQSDIAKSIWFLHKFGNIPIDGIDLHRHSDTNWVAFLENSDLEN